MGKTQGLMSQTQGLMSKAQSAIGQAQGLAEKVAVPIAGLTQRAIANPLPGNLPPSGATASKREIKNALVEEYCKIVRDSQPQIEKQFIEDVQKFLTAELGKREISEEVNTMVQDIILSEIENSLLDDYFVQHQMVIILYGAVGNGIVNRYIDDNVSDKSRLDTLSSSKITDYLLEKLEEDIKTHGGNLPPVLTEQTGGKEYPNKTAELLHFFPLNASSSGMNSKMAYVVEKGITDALKATMESDEIQGLIKEKIGVTIEAYMKKILAMFEGKEGEQIKLQKMMLYTLLSKVRIRERFNGAIEEALKMTKLKPGEPSNVSGTLKEELNNQIKSFFSGKVSGRKSTLTGEFGAALDGAQGTDKQGMSNGGGGKKRRKTKRWRTRKPVRRSHTRKSKRL